MRLYSIWVRDFDIIIRMDWLGRNQAFLECVRKKVLQGLCKSEMMLIFQELDKSSCIVFYIKAVKLSSERCQAYMASLVDSTKETEETASIPVVSEFYNVFPPKVLAVPPPREVEFTIDVVTRFEPISRAPYRMAPIELKELKA